MLSYELKVDIAPAPTSIDLVVSQPHLSGLD